MTPDSDDYTAAEKRVLAEYATQLNGRVILSAEEIFELREYAKSRTNLYSDQLAPDQLIWKQLYQVLSEQLRRLSTETMAKVEHLESERDGLKSLEGMIAAKLAARPRDYGVRAWWGFVILGASIGWVRSAELLTSVLYGLASSSIGVLFAIFVLDSAEVQARVGIFLCNRMRMEGVGKWLYRRSLTIR
ncbi:MAG: hypothetical protein IT158_28515 [Bryobacterales bacterium]|nr:hypothetical protein [Bryobacterales bacterium]